MERKNKNVCSRIRLLVPGAKYTTQLLGNKANYCGGEKLKSCTTLYFFPSRTTLDANTKHTQRNSKWHENNYDTCIVLSVDRLLVSWTSGFSMLSFRFEPTTEVLKVKRSTEHAGYHKQTEASSSTIYQQEYILHYMSHQVSVCATSSLSVCNHMILPGLIY